VLVLDDYHLISDNSVHELITELVRYSPRKLVSRHSGPFRSAAAPGQLPARGHLTELRAVDLRFTVEETARLLRDSMRLPIDDQAVAILRTRTEGWAVGLRLVALYYRHRGQLNAQNLESEQLESAT